jgi:acetate kinase
MELDPSRNEAHAEVISTNASRVVVRVIRTDEELMIARYACRLVDAGADRKKSEHEIKK